MDGATEPYREVFTGVSRPCLPPPQTELRSTYRSTVYLISTLCVVPDFASSFTRSDNV